MLDFKSRIEIIFKKIDRFSNLSQTEYVELVSKELRRQSFFIEEENWLEKYASLLSPNIKNLFEYNIHTRDEFIRRLIMYLNIADNSSSISNFPDQTNILSAILIKILYEVSSERLKQEKPNLFAQKNPKNSEEMEQLINAWSEVVQDEEHLKIQKQISLIIAKLIQPCILDFNTEIKEIVQLLNTTPQSITDSSVLKTLEEISEHRDKDCKLLRRSSKEIGKNASEVLMEIENAILDNNEHIKEIAKIRKSIVKREENFEQEKETLIDIADILHKKIININSILKNKEEKIKHLYDEINTLSLYIKTIEEQSKMDSLTEVYNRKHIDNIAEICERQFQTDSINYSILFFDIDNFKNINDIYGHTAGDKLLAIFSKILKKNCRGSDIEGDMEGMNS
ncbi:GGDEF domain-containing protein [Helicobacter sp. 12S02232-10]|uniref:diguanylate cyclase n=1 Tax=Helicobacter sp. 12S02232-10 TaxID=1476197 RepID=UPI000BA51FEC